MKCPETILWMQAGRRRAGAAVLGALLAQPAGSAETNQPAASVIFRVGMSSACFRNVNRNDAIAAYKTFLEASGRRRGNIYKAETEVFEDAPAFEAALRRQPKNLAVIEAWQYLSMDLGSEFRPYFVVTERGKVGRKYLILTRRNSGFKTLADLRGQRILQLRHSSVNAGKVWLDALLLGGRLCTQETILAAWTWWKSRAPRSCRSFSASTPPAWWMNRRLK